VHGQVFYWRLPYMQGWLPARADFRRPLPRSMDSLFNGAKRDLFEPLPISFKSINQASLRFFSKQYHKMRARNNARKVAGFPQDVPYSSQLMPHVCRIPKPNKCEGCVCIHDPVNPNQQICANQMCRTVGHYRVPGSMSKYAISVHAA
jgi:hypothetical protein